MSGKNAIKMRILRRLVKACPGRTGRAGALAALAVSALCAAAAYYLLHAQLRARTPPVRPHRPPARAPPPGPARPPGAPAHLYAELGVPFVELEARSPYVPRERIVHLDLKGAPPQKVYLQRIFPFIKNLGATGILIEYEDMFPYSGQLEDVTAYNHYTRKDVLEIISMAENSGLKIIPLVQTFGHVEFALKRPSLMHLRENSDSPQALCPSLNASLVFIENMISQVMELHRHHITHLHIGCDEVFHLAECKLCTNRTYDNDGGRSKDIVFLKHVINVAKMVKRRWPEIRLLIWDDMLRHVSDDLLSVFEIGTHVDPVIWWYTEDIYRFIPTMIWQKYSQVFQTAWTASAFKGAFGENLNIPNVRRHLENNLQWLKVMSEQNKYFPQGLAGIMLTGWQRYDHFAVLCELLPAALPSLSLTLLSTSLGHVNSTTLYKFGSALGCPETQTLEKSDSRPPFTFNLENDPFMWEALKNCIFPGSRFFRATSKLNVAETEAYEFIEQVTRRRGWLTDYNIHHKFTSADRIDTIVSQDTDASKILKKLVYVAEYSKTALQYIADEHTAAEWIEQKVKMEKILADAVSLKKSRTWERRPLKPQSDLSRFGQTVDDLFPI